jgi:hypothetical protein
MKLEEKQEGRYQSFNQCYFANYSYRPSVFSFDSILTAVGMTNGVPGALYIMITAVVMH